MPAKVRATCPGCRTVLRIPADWADRPVKCKKCGAVLQGKHPTAPPPSAATVDTAPATPLPGTVPMGQPVEGSAPPPGYGYPVPPGFPAPGYQYPPTGYPYTVPPGYGYGMPPGYPAPPGYPYPAPPAYAPPGYGYPAPPAPGFPPIESPPDTLP